MSKVPPPLLGFNNNVRHRGRIFHIQTEDSGVKYPRIVTHLFADGGRIVRTTRTDYSEHLGREDMNAVLRQMMKEQHKAMFIALRAGELDDLIVKCCGPLPGAAPEAPQPSRDATGVREAGAAADPAGASTPDPASAAPVSEVIAPPVSSLPLSTGVSAEETPTPAPSELAGGDAAPRRRPRRPPTLDDVTVRGVAAAITAAGASDEAFSASTASGAPQRRRESRPPSSDAESGSHEVAAEPAALYAPARPPAIFEARPEPPRSLFGDNLISEKSLDEVILSYLAEDLEEGTG